MSRRFNVSSLPYIEVWGTSVWTWLGVILIAAFFGVLNVLSQGAVLSIIMLVGVGVIIVVSLLRPTVSLYLLVFLSLVIEQISDYYSWTFDLPYHKNLNNIHPRFSGIAINPLELHLACIVVGMLLRFSLLKEKPVPVLVKAPLVAYVTAIIFFLVYGVVVNGGAMLPAMWEVRGIFYLFALMAIVPQLIRTRQQVLTMLWVLIGALAFRAFEVTYHFAGGGFSLENKPGGWGSHEDAGLLASVMVFTGSLYLLKVGSIKQRVLLTLLLIPAMLAIIGSDRRTAYPVLAACLMFVGVMMPGEFQRKALRIGWKLGILFVIYLGVFWNSRSDSIFLMPVQNIREGIAGDDQEAAGERYSSNLYRKAENYDLFNMIKSQPILGHGYGVLIDYRMPVPVQWELGFYIPHNQVLGVFAKTGVVGFTIFLLFYFSVAARLARGFGELAPNDHHRAILILVGAGLINHVVYSFFDIMLTYYRNNVYLGTLFGLAGTIMAIRKQEHEETPPAAPAAPREEPQLQVHRLLQPHVDDSRILKLGQ